MNIRTNIRKSRTLSGQVLKKFTFKKIKSIKEYRSLLKNLLKNNRIKISALIPAYNEAPRIAYVLEVACKYPFFNEIVVVNDGSTDNTADVIKTFKKKCPKLVFVNLKKNRGKTGAVKQGIKKAKGDLIVMLDADLENLKQEYLDKMIYFVASKQYGMAILDRFTDRMNPFGLIGTARLLGGERAFWKKDFEKVDLSNVKNYSLEATLNLYFLRNNKKVRTVLAPDLKAKWQFSKWGLKEGLKRYIKEFWEVYKASGARNFYIQLAEIEEEPITELHDWYRKAGKNKFLKETLRPGLLVVTTLASVGIVGYLAARYTKNKLKEKLPKGSE